jgi:hypothetical protein
MSFILAMRHFYSALTLKLPALSQEAHDEAPSLAAAMEVFYMYAINSLFDNSEERNQKQNKCFQAFFDTTITQKWLRATILEYPWIFMRESLPTTPVLLSFRPIST